MGEETRKTGLDFIGDVAWGTHLCQFYQTEEDLIDILVPYFKAGLENNEFCMWVTSGPFTEEDAMKAMATGVPNFDQYLRRGQMEIVPHGEWYLKDGAFDLQRVLGAWIDKLNQALSKGYDGIRITGNTAWLEKREWVKFADYEEEVNSVIGKYQIIAICSYPLDNCTASELIDVVNNHQSVLVKRRGKWEHIENSERKRTEETLQKSEKRYKFLYENSPSVNLIIGVDGIVKDVNSLAIEKVGYAKDEIIGKPALDFVAPEDREEATALLERSFRGEYTPETEIDIYGKDGAIHTVLFSPSQALLHEEERLASILIIGIDITERKWAEEKLRESEGKYRSLTNDVLDSSAVGIFILDSDFKIVWVNRALERYFGIRREDIIGIGKRNLIRDRVKYVFTDPEGFAQTVLATYDNNTYVENFECLVLPDGERKERWLEHWSQPIATGLYAGGRIEHYTDITERKRAEEYIKLYLHMVESAHDAIFFKDLESRYIIANAKALEAFGLSHEKVIGRNDYELMPDQEEARVNIEDDKLVFKTGKTTEITKHMTSADGKEYWFQAIKVPQFDDKGNIVGLVSVARDITERKQALEREKQMQQELNLSSRLASIGQMASGIAHEINNPLTSVIGFSQLLLRRGIPEDIRKRLETINNEAQRVARIVENLLTFARRRKPGREYIDVNEIISQTLELRSYEMRANNIQVVIELSPELPPIVADPGQLQQVFVNIILNAEKTMGAEHGRGTLVVKTERIQNIIRASFTDDGPGISKENLDKIFDPFFTTREVGNGTGLGLSICYGIVAQHKGKLYAQSELGKGTTFFVELPIVSKREQQNDTEATSEEALPPRSGAKILVIDDERSVLDFLSSLLTEEGYQIETTDRANVALEKLKRQKYDLLLLDIKMPGMSGIELYRHIEATDLALAQRVLFITGDIIEPDTTNFLKRTKAPYITKPLEIDKLMGEINRILRRNQR